MILGFDTSGPFCTAALLRGEEVLVNRTEEMTRGQAERLMPLLEETLAEGGTEWRKLDALAVGIGPGNFTGTRIAVSAARGLALALGIPAVGVSTFEVVALDRNDERALVVLPAPRDRVYVRLLTDGRPASDPALIDPADPPDDLPSGDDTTLIGHRAGELSGKLVFGAVYPDPPDLADRAIRIARIARRRLLEKSRSVERPAPLYVRPADAAPPSDPPPVILDA
jgi:tRNA threonylcarbamoyl adenosine modification protein YeaZ